MFSYYNRQHVFRRSNGDLWNFFSDSRQNICCNTLLRRGTWSASSVLVKSAYPNFYVDMDREDSFHLLYQDNDGNIHYSRLDGQTAKSVTVLNSKSPSVYDKHLFLAPFQNNTHFFYVLQHENSFMLAYQVLASNRISNPRVVDYVSGSSHPCALAYDKAQNIYAFYQAYDGKYLQLGYKKWNAAQKSWSDFTPVTKYNGNCEYPRVYIDNVGIIHLCYQRRAPKFFELVYQQKSPDRNLWSTEEIVHSSVHSFENAFLLQDNENIIVYWVRDDVTYFNSSVLPGNKWGKASRYNFPTGRQLQCVSFKAARPHSPASGSSREDFVPLAPVLYPGSLSNGLRLAFNNMDSTGDVTQLFGIQGDFGYIPGADSTHAADGSLFSAGNRSPGTSSNPSGPSVYPASGSSLHPGNSSPDIRNLVLDAFKQLQLRMDEARDGSTSAKAELARLTNAYDQLSRELAKYSIRLGMLETQLGPAKKLSSRLDELSQELMALKESRSSEREGKDRRNVSKMAKGGRSADLSSKEIKQADTAAEPGLQLEYPELAPDHGELTQEHPEPTSDTGQDQQNKQLPPQEQLPAQAENPAKKSAVPSLDPEAMKMWEEWEEPKEWRED